MSKPLPLLFKGMAAAAVVALCLAGCGKGTLRAQPAGAAASEEGMVSFQQKEIRAQVRRYLHANKDLFAPEELERIAFLTLSGQEVTDIGDLALLPKLEELTLDGTQVKDYSVLGKLKELYRLELTNTDPGALALLPAMPGLRELVINGQCVPGLAPLNAFSQLEVLEISLSSQQPQEDAVLLAGLSNLTGLKLTLQGEGDAGKLSYFTEALGKLTHLRQLALKSEEEPDINFAFLSHMEELTTLSIDAFSDKALESLPPLKHLAHLTVNGTGTSPTKLLSLAAQPALVSLTLNRTGAVSLQSIAGMETLTTLTLTDNDGLQNLNAAAQMSRLSRIGFRGHHTREMLANLSKLLPEAYVYEVDP